MTDFFCWRDQTSPKSTLILRVLIWGCSHITSAAGGGEGSLANADHCWRGGEVGVERGFVFYQEFLIPGASVGILECTHFSEWFGYNHTRWVCVPDIILEVNRKSSQDEKIIWNKCISSSFFLPGKSWDTNNCSQESENFSLAIKKIFQATINFLKWSSPYLVFDSWSERGQEVHWCDLSLWGWSAGGGSQGGSHCLKPLPCLYM